MRNTSDNIPQKSIFSCNIYRTNNQQKSHPRTNFNAVPRDPEVLFLNNKIFKEPKTINKKQQVKECSTQTSKTIIQLAQNEVESRTNTHNQAPANFQTRQQEQAKQNVDKILNIAKNHEASNFYGDQNVARNHEASSFGPGAAASSGRTNLVQTTLQTCSVKPNCNYYSALNTSNVLAKQKEPTNTVAPKAQNYLQPQTLPVLTKNAPVPTENSPQRVTIRRDSNSSPVRIGLQIEILNDDKPEDGQNGAETGRMSPDSLTESPRDWCKNYSLENCPYSVASKLSGFTLDGSCHEQDCIFNTDEKVLDTSPSDQNNPLRRKEGFKSKSFIDTYQHPNYIQDPAQNKVLRLVKPKPRNNRRSSKSLDLPDNSFERLKPTICCQNSGFMCPTTASRIKSQMEEIQSTNCLLPPMRRGKSTSPKATADKRRFESSKKIPYIDQSKSDVSSATTLINAARHPELLRMTELELSKSECSIKFSDDVLSLITTVEASNSSFNDTTITIALSKLQEQDWRIALRGLADVVEICRNIEVDLIYDYMGPINQRLIQLLKSPRSHVSRIACQAAGHLFEYVKDTRRPIFDEIVDILLHKTADANKFIRNDANMALDCMVTHISTFNAVRSLCNKGPYHKNALVRSATARLLVCAVVLAGTDVIMNPANNEYTRKRIIVTMARFLEDKNLDTRKLAERLYKVLSKDGRFNVYLRKYLESEHITKIQNNLRLIHKK